MQFRRLSLILALGFTTACSDEDTQIGPGEPENATYAGITAAGTPGLFPHDIFTVEDPSTFTGLRVNFSAETDAGLTNQQNLTKSMAAQISQLDGFGTSAGAWIRFSAPIEIDSVLPNQNVGIGFLQGDTPVIIPAEALARTSQILIRPDVALPPNTESFFFATSGIKDREGELVRMPPELRQILHGNDDNALHKRLRETAAALVNAGTIDSTDDLVTLSVFTTQSVHEQSLEIAERIAQETITASSTGPCEVEEFYRFCTFELSVPDFVGDDQIIDPDAIDTTATYTLKGVAYLPLESDAPYEIPYDPAVGFPVSIFGHGLTGDKTQARLIAKHSAPLGVATISIDAPQHGEHPLRLNNSTQELDIILPLFGIQLEGKLDIISLHLRDGWRHSNLDKLGLVEAIKAGIELDGDNGTVDLDPQRISYLGASLGAIQGSEFLALSTDISGALLAVGGARLSDIVRFGTIFKAIINVLLLSASPDEIDRFYVLLQTAVEVGDGANWAPYVMQERVRGTLVPDIAMQSSIPDEIVPPETALILARSLGVTLIGHVPRPDHLIPEADGPLSANHASGRTAGYVQTDWMWRADRDEYVPSTHDKSPDSAEGIAYWLNAYRTHLGPEGIMNLVNPYPVTGAPPKPQ